MMKKCSLNSSHPMEICFELSEDQFTSMDIINILEIFDAVIIFPLHSSFGGPKEKSS